jgi:hypothetical protein
MTWLTDEVLSAYIDGELDPEQAAQVAVALAQDSDAASRLRRLRCGDALLRQALDWPFPDQADLTGRFAAEMQAPPPRRMAALVLGALAAAAAGVAAGWLAQPQHLTIDPDHGAFAGRDLARSLETHVDGGAGPVRITLTFRARDGRFCRSFTWGASLEGVACRERDRWRLETLWAPRQMAASAADAKSPIARTLEALGAGETFDLQQEAGLVASHWRSVGAAGGARRSQ